MKMAVVVPIFGGLHESKSFWGSLVSTASGVADLIIFDNGQHIETNDNRVSFFERYVFPKWRGKNCRYWPQEDNLGMVRTTQFVYESTDYDVLCFLHNDLYLYTPDWDEKVLTMFENADKVGMVGIFGSKGILQNGIRYHVYSNLVEAEIHGYRLKEEEMFTEVAVLDGMFMAMSRKMLDARGGVDQSFDIHHFYDIDLSLESCERGFTNWIIPVYAHHVSGQTACKPPFQEWSNQREGVDRAEYYVYYTGNQKRFVDKWHSKLPFHCERGWSTIVG